MFENEVTKGNIRDIKRFALIEIWIAIYKKVSLSSTGLIIYISFQYSSYIDLCCKGLPLIKQINPTLLYLFTHTTVYSHLLVIASRYRTNVISTLK
jgi:hypothetical protein